MNMYHHDLLDHYKYPRNLGVLAHATLDATVRNSACGDAIRMTGYAHAGVLEELMFTGTGCVISQAAASLLTERLCKTPLKTILSYDAQYMLSLINMPLGPVRIKCALLALQAVQHAILTSSHMSECVSAESSTSVTGITK